MSLRDRICERFRRRLSRVVERSREKLGSMDAATKHVGNKIGMSQMGVYRVLGRYGNVKIQAHHHVALLMLAMIPRRTIPPLIIRTNAKELEPVFSKGVEA